MLSQGKSCLVTRAQSYFEYARLQLWWLANPINDLCKTWGHVPRS